VARQLHRLFVLTLGWFLLVLGVIGLFLPVLQGVLFTLTGLYILSRESRWARRRFDSLRARFPATEAKLQEWKARLAGCWPFRKDADPGAVS